ncbi:MAG: tetratricopeptide repeat protein [Microcoleaceae cyanobacterium]
MLDSLQQSSLKTLGNQASSYVKQGQIESAINLYEKALLDQPEQPEVLYNLGLLWQKQNQPTKAIEYYHRAVAYKPDWIEAQYRLALALHYQRQFEAATHRYRIVLDLDPEQADIHCNLGCLLAEQQRTEEAIQTFQAAIVHWPNNAKLHNNLAEIFFRQKDFDRAIAGYWKAVQLQPDLLDAHQNLGRAFQQQGLHDTALQCFRKVLQSQPDSISALSYYSWSLLQLGEISEALKFLQRSVALERSFIQSYQTEFADLKPETELDCARLKCIEFLQLLQQNYDESEIRPIFAQVNLHLGNAWDDYRNYQQAEIYYQTAVKIQPDFVPAHLKLARCFEQQYRFKEAVITYQNGLKIQPNSTEMQQGLESALAAQRQAEQGIQLKPKPLNIKLPQEILMRAPEHQCQGLDCPICLQKITSKFNPLHLGDGIYQITQDGAISIDYSQAPTLHIPQGQAWIVPHQNWWNICNAIAIIRPDHELVPEVSQFYPTPLPGCSNQQDFRQHQIFKHEELPSVEFLSGRVAVLSGLSGNVYFHWMIDVLPRIEILKQQGIDLEEIDWFVLNSARSRFQRETLERLGIPLDKVIENDLHPYIQADELIVPPFPATVGWPTPFTIAFHRRLFADTQSLALEDLPKRIYISRKGAKYRRILNESEVISELTNSGFVTVALEDFSVEYQAALFSQADIIVSAHGSGLTNLMHCHPGTVVIELMAPHYLRHYFWVISQHLQLQHYYLTGDTFTCYPLRQLIYRVPLTEDLRINLDSLRKLMQIVGIRPLQRVFPQSSPSAYSVMEPQTLTSTESQAVQYHRQAENLIRQGQLSEAQRACEQALIHQPDFAPACKTYGDIQQTIGQFEVAKQWYGRAIELQPDYVEAIANLGSLHARQKQWELAIAAYQKALEYRPNSAETYRNLARVWKRLDRPIEAADCLYEAHNLEPEGITANQYISLGQTLWKHGQVTKAVNCFQSALRLDPNLLEAQQYLDRQPQEIPTPATSAPTSVTNGKQNSPSNQVPVTIPKTVISETVLPKTVAPETDRIGISELSEPKLPLESIPRSTEVETESKTELKTEQGLQQPTELDSKLEKINLSLNQASQDLKQNAVDLASTNLTAPTLADAEVAYEQAEYERVIRFCEQMIQENSRNVSAYELLGKAQQQLDQLELSLATYQKVVELKPRDAIAHTNLGNLYAQLKQWKSAIRAYGEAIYLMPDLSVAHRNLAKVWQRVNRPVEAALSLYRALLTDPEQGKPADFLSLGNLLLNQGRIDKAESCYRQVIQLDPGCSDAYHNLGEIFSARGDWQRATAAYQRAIQLNPSAFESYNSLGKALASQERWDEVLECYRQALNLNPRVLMALQNLTKALVHKVKQLGQGDSDYQVWQLMSEYLPEQKSLSPSDLDQQQMLTPSSTEISVSLEQAEWLYTQNQYSACVAACQKLVRSQPKSFEPYLLLARSLAAQERLEEAQAAYQQAIHLKPHQEVLYLELGSLYRRQQNWNAAIACYRRAEMMYPNWVEVRQALGDLWFQQEQWEKAATYYRQVIERDRQRWDVHYKLVDSLQAQGLLEEAIVACREAETIALET